MTEQPTATTALPARRPEVSTAQLDSSLTRYRVMAWITGVFLLLLCAEMVAKYGFGNDKFGWVGTIHGFIYIVYLASVLDLWSRLKWDLKNLVTLILAGVVPLLSFVAEHRTVRVIQPLLADDAG